MSRTSPALVGLLFAAALGACSSDNGGAPSTLTIAKAATNSGDAQTGTAGVALANPLRVVVTDGGVAQSGVTVDLGHRPTAEPSLPVVHTDAGGVATATWTLGAGGGAQTATASLSGATGSPVSFTATAPVVPTITVGPGGAAVFSPATTTISAGQSVHFVWASGCDEPQRDSRYRQRGSAAGQSRPAGAAQCSTELQRHIPVGGHLQVLLHRSWQQSVAGQRRRHVRHRDGQLGRSRLP